MRTLEVQAFNQRSDKCHKTMKNVLSNSSTRPERIKFDNESFDSIYKDFCSLSRFIIRHVREYR